MNDLWFDASRLARWLSLRIAGGAAVDVACVRRVMGGLSAETYQVSATWRGDGGEVARELILRRDPATGLRRLSGGVEREFRVMSALHDSPAPVPRVYALELDPAWLERPFMVEEFVTGSSDRNLLNSVQYDAMRAEFGERFIQILADLHRLDVRASALQFLDDPGEGTEPAAREVARWEGLVEQTKQEPNPLLVEAFIWLKAHLPRAPRVSIVHGEFRPGNLLYEGSRIIAVLDWEYAHLGDPVEDLGWAFLRQFRVWDRESGLFPREEFLARYETKAGLAVDREAVLFWEVFSNVKVLAMLSDGQDAFAHKLVDGPLVSAVPGSNLQAEVARLIGL